MVRLGELTARPFDAKERAWLTSAGEWALSFDTSFEELAGLTGDDLLRANYGDPDAVLAVALPLGFLGACSVTLKSQVGPPPTKRLRPINKRLEQSCGSLKSAAKKYARGVDEFDPGLIDAAGLGMERAGEFADEGLRELKELEARIK